LGRFIYEPGWIIPSQLTEDALGGKYEVRIAYRFLGRDNLGVQKRKVWGTEIYTDDSDAVASTSPHLPLPSFAPFVYIHGDEMLTSSFVSYAETSSSAVVEASRSSSNIHSPSHTRTLYVNDTKRGPFAWLDNP